MTVCEQEVFCECLECPLADRGRWLQAVCAENPELKARIERLLAAHEAAEQACLDDVFAAEEIDGYRIVRIVGEGGMGVVYEAIQDEPLQRRVALKAVRRGMDTTEVLARFRAERQALAAMEHPYIAKVFDAGNTPSGRPYFVMEYVDGRPLLKFCLDEALSLNGRLELFILICQAVQHAHQKGVIHRDLKPGNILVTNGPEEVAPRIIDFGIARAMTRGLEPRLTQTVAGIGPGTPAYMSPEQAGYQGLDVDTRSDVYSLGVILYELLTGCLPISPELLGPFELLRQLGAGDLDITTPSRCVAEFPEVTPFPPKQFAGDLDAIILKALETDRDLRYQTALAFAQDLRNYLDGRPVTAVVPTLLYRVRKYWQRRRIHVIAASVTVAALAAGVVAGGYGLMQARRAEAMARQEAATARHISSFLTSLFTLSDPNRTPGSPMTVRDVLDEGTRRVQSEMSAIPETQAALLGTLSHVHESIGSYRAAKALAERAVALRASARDAETADTFVTLGRTAHRLGEFDDARRALAQALAIRSQLYGDSSMEVAEVWNLLGAVDGQLERFGEAEEAHRKALAIQERVKGVDSIATYNSWRGLGMVLDRQGKKAEALVCFQRVLPIARQRYGQEHPIVADALHNIAISLDDLGQLSEAEAMYVEAHGMNRKLLGVSHPSVAFTAAGLGSLYHKQGRLREAEPLLRDAMRIREATLGADNVRTAESRKTLGLVRVDLGAVDEGYRMLRKAIEDLERAYGPKHSDVLGAHREAGLALLRAGRYRESVPHLMRVVGPDTPAKVRLDRTDPLLAELRRSGAAPDLFHGGQE